MRFEPPRAFLASHSVATAIAPELAFLRLYRDDGEAVLRNATVRARETNVCPVQALVSSGDVSAAIYYRALARHLGRPFDDTWPVLAPLSDLTEVHRAGRVALSDRTGPRWIVAPTGETLRDLLRAKRLGAAMPDIAITTPDHLSALIEWRAQPEIERVACERLPQVNPRLSARHALLGRGGLVAAVFFVAWLTLFCVVPHLFFDALCLAFFAAACFRLWVCTEAAAPCSSPPLADADLPNYTVLVALKNEASMVGDLLAALEALDYPRAKLEILVLVEAEDATTQAALSACRLPPHLRVIVAPGDRTLRTKPRALNIGLLAARGSLITVYDAEDHPASDQLRLAAARFAAGPKDLGCLQASLAIGNGDDGLLPRLFAIEYAQLFDLYNLGATARGLPMALGGTSNHFRASILRDVGGWDAWNVTEDADLGLRLARFGYRVESLASTTIETAPETLGVWMKQRRRWTKGWMQTCLVLAGDAPTVVRQLGVKRSAALMPILMSLIVGPLLLPWLWCLVAWSLLNGLPDPANAFEIAEATLATSLFVLGIAAMLGCAYVGMRARGLRRFVASLPLMLPYQVLVSVAALMGLIDLVRNPHHWHKTPHRTMRRQDGKLR